MLTGPVLIDFSGSLAILAMLSVAYGGLHRVLLDKRWLEPILGILFGLIAFVQMHNPVEVYPGMIIDMRNVPLVLAGAFLGGRGLLPCIVIAALARIDIGGVGMLSALAAMTIAGGVGLLWQGVTRGRERGVMALVALGAAASLHLIGAVLLPLDLMIWFLFNAAPLLIGLNFVAIPIVGALLERERKQIRRVETLTRTAGFTIGKGLMAPEAFEWSLNQSSATGSLHGPASAFGIRIRFQGALARFWGKDADIAAMKMFHERLAAVMPAGGIVGWAQEDLVVMAIPKVDAEGARDLLTQIRREVSSTSIAMPGMTPFRLVLDLDVRHYRQLPTLERLVADLSPADIKIVGQSGPVLTPTLAQALRRRRSPVVASAPARMFGPQSELFSTFDRLLAARLDVS
ncbi:LytS/YhcK type 5TM receptor domain-containing protein [Jannaschia donghaensis]|uniref:5TMR of 5TMR-LYT n=1 Tax=Jannaschia donghaensis TaxID=420998 RepID=A0A0M6YKU5_9RHOB|nr:LytS/YhcK type 5TM receptor domain-containing protein [Jannaschia donghaensis]CTQ49887.1 5TMR of 5TMR-LYT [Jannaschia donghaensis]